MKSYPERIAEILVKAPPVPPLKRKHEATHTGVSDDTRAKLILIHASYATFGHPLEQQTRTL